MVRQTPPSNSLSKSVHMEYLEHLFWLAIVRRQFLEISSIIIAER